MENNDRKAFAEIIYGLAEDIGTNISKPGLQLKFEALKSFPIEDVKSAALEIMKTWKSPRIPPVSVFLEHLGVKKIDAKNRAEIEADKIISHLNFYGSTEFPNFDDPVTRHLMSHRWPYLRWAKAILESDLKWWRKDFLAAYQAFDMSGEAKFLEAPQDLKKLAAGIGKTISS